MNIVYNDYTYSKIKTKSRIMKSGLYHTILISFKPDTPQEIQDTILSKYKILGEECGGENAGILFWTVQKNLDKRKNIHLVEFAIFKNQEALDLFKKHEKHISLIDEFLVKYCDWKVGDFIL